MGFSLTSWLIGQALGVGTAQMVKRFLTTDRAKRLQSIVAEWTHQLPENLRLLSADAMFPDRQHGANDSPAPTEILDRLNNGEMPTEQDWASAIWNQWEWVRANNEECQPFFDADRETVSPYVDKLCQRLQLECHRDQDLFRSDVMRMSMDAAESLKELEAGQSALMAGQADLKRLHADAAIQFGDLQSILNSPSAEPSGRFHAEIDECSRHNEDKPDVAIAALEKLKRYRWEEFSPREKYRVEANLGHAYEAKEEFGASAKHFIAARQHLPNDEKARCLEAVAYFSLGKNSTARQLAQEIRGDFPQSELAAAICVRTSPKDCDFGTLESDIPQTIRESVEVASALTWHALGVERFTDAERYARIALAKKEDSTTLIEHLAIVLWQTCGAEARVQYSTTPVFKNPERLDEAKKLFERSLEKCFADSARARRRYCLGMIEFFLGNHDEALYHYRESHRLDPDNSEVAKQYALSLESRDPDTAIAILKAAANNDSTLGVLYANFLLDRNGPGDTQEAIDVLTDKLQDLGPIEYPTRLQVPYLLARAHCTAKDYESAHAIIGSASCSEIPKAYRLAIKSAIAFESGNKHDAQRLGREASDAIDPHADTFLRRLIALSLMSSEVYAEAFSLFKDLVASDCVTSDTFSLLRCAHFCEEDEFTINFCAQLRASGNIDRECIHVELDALQKYHCFDSVEQISTSLIGEIQDGLIKRELQARRSHLLVMLDRRDEAKIDSAALPSASEVEPHLGFAVMQIFRETDRHEHACSYAYDLLRNNFNSSWAHKAMIYSLLGEGAKPPNTEHSNAVAVDTAVVYQDNESQAVQTFVIENGSNPDATRSEYSSDHALSKATIGKEEGDTFVLHERPVLNHMGTILKIQNKYVYRFNKCAEEWQDRFPDEPFLWKFVAPKNEAGELDLSLLHKSVDDRIRESRERERIYKTSPISTTVFANVCGVTPVEAIFHLGSNEELPIRCCTHDQADTTAPFEMLDSNESLLLDGSALATLFVTDSLDLLSGLQNRLTVTAGTIAELRFHFLQKRRMPPSAITTKIDGAPVFFEHTPEDIEDHLARYKSFIDHVTTNFEVVEGRALARLPHSDRERLITTFERPCAESIAEAVESGAILWSDDFLVSVVASELFDNSRVWTDVVCDWQTERGMFGAFERSQLTKRLIDLGYAHTRLTFDQVLGALREADWDAAHEEVAPLLKWFSNDFTSPAQSYEFAAQVMLGVTQETSDKLVLLPSSFSILRQIAKRTDGQQLVRLLRDRIIQHAGLNYILGARLRNEIATWISSSV